MVNSSSSRDGIRKRKKRTNLDKVIASARVADPVPVDGFGVAQVGILLNENGPALDFRQRFESNFLEIK